MGFQCPESIQVTTQNLVKTADVALSLHEAYGGEKQCRIFLPFYATLFFHISPQVKHAVFHAIALKGCGAFSLTWLS